MSVVRRSIVPSRLTCLEENVARFVRCRSPRQRKHIATNEGKNLIMNSRRVNSLKKLTFRDPLVTEDRPEEQENLADLGKALDID